MLQSILARIGGACRVGRSPLERRTCGYSMSLRFPPGMARALQGVNTDGNVAVSAGVAHASLQPPAGILNVSRNVRKPVSRGTEAPAARGLTKIA